MKPELEDYLIYLEDCLADAEPGSKEYNEIEEDLASLQYHIRKLKLITMKYDPMN